MLLSRFGRDHGGGVSMVLITVTLLRCIPMDSRGPSTILGHDPTAIRAALDDVLYTGATELGFV
jgi:hypothetical protein